MLKLRRDGQSLVGETAVGTLKWDAERGGQITAFCVRDELYEHPLLQDGQPIPDLQFVVDGQCVRLADQPANLEVVSEETDRIVLRATAELLSGALKVQQTYEMYREGVVFCEMAIEVASGRTVELTDCSLNVAVDTSSAARARWGYCGRDPWCKVDATTVHAFTTFKQFLPLDETRDEAELYALVSLDLGWETTRFYSNHVEFLLEDWTALDYGEKTNTRTRVGRDADGWGVHWHLYRGGTTTKTGPFRYRNRWALLFGTARTRAGADVAAGMRNNVLGCRVAHAFYPYVREGSEWPWIVMPARQIIEQEPQWFVGFPELSRADEAAELGANVMILHQFWMSNPGSNNEPVADYHPADRKWLKEFVDRCHQLGMRVGLYIRGTEMHSMYSSFFEDFMQKDWDGLYADWATPFGMGYVKCSPMHVSALNYFHFSRALRNRVGEGGFLVGHSSTTTFMGLTVFDAVLGGEVSVRHDELLGVPESSAYYSLLSACGGHLISGNLPDRIAFSSEKATAVCAAFGMTGHPFMEPDAPFSGPCAYIKPLWDAMRALPGNVVRLHNPAYSPTRAVSMEAEGLFPSLWQSDAGKALLLVTNLGQDGANGTVELDLSELDVPASATVQPLSVEGTAACQADGATVRIEDIPSSRFCAALIG